MREKVKQFSKGLFNRPDNEIEISLSSIEIPVEEGCDFKGEFVISSKQSIPFKGMVTSSNSMVTLENNSFIQKEFICRYEVRSEYLTAEDTIKGEFLVIADGGQYLIPYCFTITRASIDSQLGPIRDLYQFADLASKNLDFALRLFSSKSFEQVILRNSPKKALIYRNLVSSSSISQAMEEFLLSEHKKKITTLELSGEAIRIYANNLKEEYTITIKAKLFGYIGAVIKSNTDFITIGQNVFTNKDFVDDSYPLTIYPRKELLGRERKEGTISIWNNDQMLTIHVDYIPDNQQNHCEKSLDIRRKELQVRMMKEYFDYRTNKISLPAYRDNNKKMIAGMEDIKEGEPTSFWLMRIHLLFVNKELTQAAHDLKAFNDQVELNHQELFIQCYYKFLEACLDQTREQVLLTHSFLEQSGKQMKEPSFCYLMMLYLEPEIQYQRGTKLGNMKILYKGGAHSPFLYFEACNILNEEPELLMQLSDFELSVLYWGGKNNYIHDELKEQFVELASKVKMYQPLIFKILQMLYLEKESKAYLTVLCSLLIKGNKLKSKYHMYYKQGIEAGVKLIGLNEYFIKSMDYSGYEILPREILFYFVSTESLNENETAYLYANITQNRESYSFVYDDYVDGITKFLKQQLIKSKMNTHLAYLYNQYLERLLLDEEAAKALPNILFRKKIICQHPHIKGVIVCHPDEFDADYIPLVNQTAYVDIYDELSVIILVDELSRRYVTSISYEVVHLFSESKYLAPCFQYNKEDRRLLLSLGRQIFKYQKLDSEAVTIAKLVYQLDHVRSEIKNSALLLIIRYYYDNYEGDILEEYLEKSDLKELTKKERKELTQYFVARHMYDKARDSFHLFGYQEIALKSLLKTAAHYIKQESENPTKEEDLLVICMNAFKGGRFSNVSLEYLVKYYIGDIKDMRLIWKTASEQNIDTRLLEENILAQSLFCEINCEEDDMIFESYYHKKGDKTLLLAYLKYKSHEAFYKQTRLSKEVGQILLPFIVSKSIIDDWSIMAALAYYGTLTAIEEDTLVVLKELLYKMIDEDKIMPFFKEYDRHFSIPANVMIKTYIMHVDLPNQSILLSYHITKESTHSKDLVGENSRVMTEIISGMYTAEFILFHGEKLVYRVKDERGKVLWNDHDIFNKKETRFDVLNLMLVSHELHEQDTTYQLAKDYIKQTSMIDGYINLL